MSSNPNGPQNSGEFSGRDRSALTGGEHQRKEQEAPKKAKIVPVLVAFLFGAAAGITFLRVYWTTYQTMLMGWTLGLSLALFGVAFVLWGHESALGTETSQPREIPVADPKERQLVFEESYPAGEGVQRRRLLGIMGTAVAAFFAATVVSFFRSFSNPPDQTLFGVVWKAGDRLVGMDGKPVPNDALVSGSAIIVFPEGQVGSVHAQTVLIRVNPEDLRLPPERSDWAPMGYVAYSRVCTHAGCPVGEFQAESNLLLCPCHQSTFAVLEGARPTGGPAARSLPQLPLYAGGDGFLHAGGDFDQKPGPGFWRY
jgi:ubiquinol-cytochrome c reductase iron-sulfur subunit